MARAAGAAAPTVAADGAALPAPPGLAEASEAAACAGLEHIEELMQRVGNGVTHRDVLDAIREAVLREVDARVAQKSEELWAKGKQAMANMQKLHKETTDRLNGEIAGCLEQQRALEAENESLRLIVQGLSTRLSALFPAINAKRAGGDAAEESTVQGSSPSLTHERDSPDQSAGGLVTPRSDNLNLIGKPMMVPSDGPSSCFSTPVSPVTPLPPQPPVDGGAEQRKPAFINSLAPGAPIVRATAATAADKTRFSFTLRKADGVELGLHVSHHEHDKVIRVEGIKAEGAIGAWNRQWAGSCAGQTTGVDKVVMVGDKIVSVNGISGDAHRMLKECKDKVLLKIEIMRGLGDQTPPETLPTSKTTGLRADAVAFVPTLSAALSASSMRSGC